MNSRVIVALDYADAKSALALVDRLQPSACKLKVGKELFTAAGPAFVATIAQRGFDIFLDLKFHDIPNTVAQACKAAAQLGVCSAHEAAVIRDRLGSRFRRITPGIRLPGDGAGDQKRVMTPRLAIASGASYLVIGRPVTRAADPLAVLARINGEIAVLEAQK